jgi:hypothetical protein
VQKCKKAYRPDTKQRRRAASNSERNPLLPSATSGNGRNYVESHVTEIIAGSKTQQPLGSGEETFRRRCDDSDTGSVFLPLEAPYGCSDSKDESLEGWQMEMSRKNDDLCFVANLIIIACFLSLY